MSTLCHTTNCTTPGFPVFHCSRSLLKLTSMESVMPSNHLILCHTLLLVPSLFPSIRVFSNKSALCIRWPKYWSFSNSPSNEYLWLISFRIDWFDLLIKSHKCSLEYSHFMMHLMRNADFIGKEWWWERLRAGKEGDDRGWDSWMVSPSQWTWVWANSRR